MKKYWQDGPIVTTDLFSHIVKKRDLQDLERFLTPRWPDHLHDPLLLPDMEKASQRFWHAIRSNEAIGIVGDYDMDGTPGAVLLYQFLERLGKKAEVILPTRSDGYGFSVEFVDRLCQKGVKLIVTVDCGIRDTEAVERAKSVYGCDVIITDHHECPDELPPALAVINPKRPDSKYPFRELCGTGVIFKCLEAFLTTAPAQEKEKIPSQWLAWSLDLVAMATISDMVPLVDENRVLAHFGLRVLQKTPRIGLDRFMQAIELDKSMLSYADIAFKLTPKFNASGRLEDMDAVFTLLSTQDPREADRAVKLILTRNTQCQILLTNMMTHALELGRKREGDAVILLADDRWHPGLTGIVAGRLVEQFQRPVGILAGTPDNQYRGSMRSPQGVALPQLLAQSGHFLSKFGGHEQAAGLSLNKDMFEAFRDNVLAHPLPPCDTVFQTDGILNPDTVTLADLQELARLAPWGVGNVEPVWSFCNVQLCDTQWLSDGKHLRASIPGSDMRLPLIFFGAGSQNLTLDRPVDILATLAINEFRGNKQPQVMVKSIALRAHT